MVGDFVCGEISTPEDPINQILCQQDPLFYQIFLSTMVVHTPLLSLINYIYRFLELIPLNDSNMTRKSVQRMKAEILQEKNQQLTISRFF